jgi:hypothetical protein
MRQRLAPPPAHGDDDRSAGRLDRRHGPGPQDTAPPRRGRSSASMNAVGGPVGAACGRGRCSCAARAELADRIRDPRAGITHPRVLHVHSAPS